MSARRRIIRARAPQTGDARTDRGFRDLARASEDLADRLDKLESPEAAAAPAAARMRMPKNETGGTVTGTLTVVSGSGADTVINNNFAEVYALLERLYQIGRAKGDIE